MQEVEEVPQRSRCVSPGILNLRTRDDSAKREDKKEEKAERGKLPVATARTQAGETGKMWREACLPCYTCVEKYDGADYL